MSKCRWDYNGLLPISDMLILFKSFSLMPIITLTGRYRYTMFFKVYTFTGQDKKTACKKIVPNEDS